MLRGLSIPLGRPEPVLIVVYWAAVGHLRWRRPAQRTTLWAVTGDPRRLAKIVWPVCRRARTRPEVAPPADRTGMGSAQSIRVWPLGYIVGYTGGIWPGRIRCLRRLAQGSAPPRSPAAGRGRRLAADPWCAVSAGNLRLEAGLLGHGSGAAGRRRCRGGVVDGEVDGEGGDGGQCQTEHQHGDLVPADG